MGLQSLRAILRAALAQRFTCFIEDACRLLTVWLSQGQVSGRTYYAALGGKGIFTRDCCFQEGHRVRQRQASCPFDYCDCGADNTNARQKEEPPAFYRERYRQEIVIERSFGQPKEDCRVAARYDKKASHYEAFIVLAVLKW